MDLTFQVPMQYCSLQHQTLLLSPVTSTAGYCFCFGSIPSFFLELFLHWSPVAYWAPNDLGSSSFGIISFCLFLLFMGFSRHEYWSVLPFPSPVDHILSGLSIMTHPSWVAPQATLGPQPCLTQWNQAILAPPHTIYAGQESSRPLTPFVFRMITVKNISLLHISWKCKDVHNIYKIFDQSSFTCVYYYQFTNTDEKSLETRQMSCWTSGNRSAETYENDWYFIHWMSD